MFDEIYWTKMCTDEIIAANGHMSGAILNNDAAFYIDLG